MGPSRKKAAPLINPDVDPGCSRVRDEVGIAVPIHIGQYEGDDQIVAPEPLPLLRGGEADRELARPWLEFNPIANAVAIEIGAHRVRLGEIRDEQRGEAANRREDQLPRDQRARVNDAVAVQGTCDLNPSL